MKRLTLLITLLIIFFFAAVALVPALIDGKGYITLVTDDTVHQTTIFYAVFLLTLTFFALLLLLIILRGGLKFSLGSWRKVTLGSQRRALRNFNKGMTAYVIDDYAQAEKLLAKSAPDSPFEQTAYLLAASAAAKQSLGSSHYLERVSTNNKFVKNAGIEGVLVKIKLLVEQQEYPQARALIDQYHKYIGHDARLLGLEVDLCLLESRFEAAIDYLILARKQKTLTAEKISLWEQSAFSGLFNEKITLADKSALFDYWKSLPGKIQKREPVLLAYCQVLAKHQLTEPLTELLLPVIKKDPSEQALRGFRQLPIHHADSLIAQVQKQLSKHGQDGKWLSYLGHLARNSEQWQMSEKAFNSLLALEPACHDAADLQALANVLTQQEKFEQANIILTRCLNQQEK